MKSLPLCLFALFALGSHVAAESLPEKSEVFPPGFNGVAHYRIPGIVVTPAGTVLAYCEARRKDRKDWGEIEIHLRRSTDGGRTWEPSQHIAHHGERLEGNPRKPDAEGAREQTVNNPVAIVDRETGIIEFLYCFRMAGIIAHPSQPGTLLFSNPHSLGLDKDGKEIPAGRGKRENLSIKLSRDDGKTWSVNKTLEAGPSAYSDLAVLPDGTVLCLYEDGQSISCARFTLEWVEAP